MRHGAALQVSLPLAGMMDRLAHAAGSTPASASKALTTAAAVMDSPGLRVQPADESHLHPSQISRHYEHRDAGGLQI